MNEFKPAKHFQKLESGKVQCTLCPVGCKLGEGKVGICYGKKNINGVLYAINYGEVVSSGIDPIEKKPLYHFYPGSQILSVGPNGCNLRCPNCQNWTISQEQQSTQYISPEQLVQSTRRSGSIGIAYTYSEPLIWYEYILDTAALCREVNLKTVLVSNGYINEQPFREIVSSIDAMNIDVKSMQPEFYEKICKGSLDDVQRTVEIAVESGVSVEVTNLVITNKNDSDADFHKLTDWLAGINRKIPLHFSRYFPQHKMDEPATPSATLKKAYEIAREKLDYVYVGNISLPGTSDTFCPQCRNLLVKRNGYYTEVTGIVNGKCGNCGREVDIIL